jgi:hypothetical protein
MRLKQWLENLRSSLLSGGNRDSLEVIGNGDDPSEGDVKVLAELDRLGADFTVPRHVIHYLYFRTKTAAVDAAFALRGEGYVTRADQKLSPHTRSPWPVVAETIGVVNADTMAQARAALTAFAERHGGEYDGWEAALD